MKYIILILVLIALLAQTTPAQADNFDPGAKANSHVVTKNAPSCTKANLPRLWYYMDGDTPTPIAYQDYLEDLNHWAQITDDNCNVKPETL